MWEEDYNRYNLVLFAIVMYFLPLRWKQSVRLQAAVEQRGEGCGGPCLCLQHTTNMLNHNLRVAINRICCSGSAETTHEMDVYIFPMADWNGKVILVLVNRETLTFTFALRAFGRCFYPKWLTVSTSVERCCLIIIIVIHNSILGHLLIWSSE